MTWNYRVIKTIEDGQPVFTIHGVYYAKEGRPTLWSEEPIAPMGESLEELNRDLMFQAAALAKPVLVVATGTFLREEEEEEDDHVE